MATASLEPPDLAGIDRRPLTIPGPDGPVPALVFTPARDHQPERLVLLGHGGGGGKDHPRFQRLAAQLARALGAATLVLDGPVHGDRQPRDGTPLERFRAGRRALIDPELPTRFAEEWRAGIALLRREGIGGGALGYAGFSMGVLLGVPVVASLGEVRAAVFGVGGVPAPGGVAQLIGDLAGPEAAAIAEEEDDADRRGRIVLDAATRLGPTEVLMLNTTGDRVFPPANAFALFDAIPGAKRIAFWPGGHTDLSGEAIELAIAFLDRALGDGDRRGPNAAPPAAW